MTARVLVAGIGNIFLGDDAFGVEVVKRLLARPLPKDVKVVDFGIRGLDLTYALMDGYEAAILVDATPRGREPGTLYVLEPDVEVPADPMQLALEGHSMDPARVLATVRALGGNLGKLRVVGCEPAQLGSDEELADGLSPAVAAAIEPARELVEGLLGELLEVPHA